MIPCSVKSFQNSQLDEAMGWLSEDDSTFNYRLNISTGILTIAVSGPLASDSFYRLSDTVDRWLKQGNILTGIQINTTSFPGWEDFGSLISHVDFISEHRRRVARIALVTDSNGVNLAAAIGQYFVKAEVRQFDADEKESARAWLENPVK